MVTFKIGAAVNRNGGAWIDIDARVATVEEAREIAAQFTKSTLIRGTGCTTVDNTTVGHLSVRVDLRPNGSNGGYNESGVKRYRSVIKQIAKLGHTTEWAMVYSNSLTEADLEALLAA